MWALILNDYAEFETISAGVESWRGKKYHRVETAFGAKVAQPEEEGPGLRVGYCEIDADAIRDLLIWFQHKHYIQAFIHSAVARNTLIEEEIEKIHVPTLCLRSVGRLDFGGPTPVLYEEVPLDKDLVKDLAQYAHAPNEVVAFSKVFTAEKEFSRPEDLQWIYRHTGAELSTHALGPFVQTCRSLGTPCAALYISQPKAQEAHSRLSNLWKRVVAARG